MNSNKVIRDYIVEYDDKEVGTVKATSKEAAGRKALVLIAKTFPNGEVKDIEFSITTEAYGEKIKKYTLTGSRQQLLTPRKVDNI